MATHNRTGSYGEELAARYLEEHGFTILDRNWRSGHKELDIVARDEVQLIIVEVKTRTSLEYGNPEDAVTERKIRRIVCAADAYVRKNCIDLPVRFDIITVIEPDGRAKIEHIEEAYFSPLW